LIKTRGSKNKEHLFNACILSIKFKRIKELTEEEAILDGFKDTKTAIKKVMEINNIKNENRWCYITRFRRTDEKDGGKSILFTHFKDKLLAGSKAQTIRMIFMPNYVEGEIVKIMFRKARNGKKHAPAKKKKTIKTFLN